MNKESKTVIAGKEIKFYVSFSIHGTNRFITAVKVIHIERPQNIYTGDRVVINDHVFKVVKSRRPDWSLEKDGFKLHSDDLLTKKDEPMRSAPAILSFFNKLEKLGWTIHGKQEFINRHWKK